jgi:NADPH:quinone reductase-like Zn-dependent oxidoreductase
LRSAEPGPGEARIRQAAIGLNYIDVYHRTGLYPQPLPFTPGVEGAGTVESVGEGVEDHRSPATGSPMPARSAAIPRSG